MARMTLAMDNEPLLRDLPPQPLQLPKRVRELLTMLTYRRPDGSKTERLFIERFIQPLGVEFDRFGNAWRQIGDPTCPILWSCHTDTVHKADGLQRVLFGDWIASTEKSNCLGADCTTGVWMMANMIRAGVPGRYVFHRAEEIGGLGSNHVAEQEPERLLGIKYAIAFDRKGESDVITHQGRGRTASDAFAKSLAAALHPHALGPSDGGVFTDTATYRHLVAECSNISVGYYRAHTEAEFQNVFYAHELLKTVLRADFSKLVCERDPADADDDDWWGGFTGYGARTRTGDAATEAERMEDVVWANSEGVAEFLIDCGYTVADIEEYLGLRRS